MKTAIFVSVLILSIALNSPAQPATRPATGQIAEAAKKFLATLDDAQRAKVQFDFKDDAQRKRWSNLPSPIFQRKGLRMGDLTQPQRDAAMAVLAAALSPQGYEKIVKIVDADEFLKDSQGGGRRGPGGGLIFGRDNYFISLLGQPSATDPWMIQFGGHHLGLNITLVGEQGTLAPSHTGAQPAHYQFEGKTIRPLGGEVDKSFELINSLDESQRKKAILGVQMRDLVLGPGRDGQMIEPEGIKGSDLTEKQQQMLLDLAGEWTGILNDAEAGAKMEQMKKDIAEICFAWAGPTEKGSGAYFRIQGPSVFIEYAPQRMGGDTTNHIHTIYRDPTNDYGVKWTKR